LLTGKPIFAVTGEPGTGKSTLILKVVRAVRSRGFSVGGFITGEIKDAGRRRGFTIEDLALGRQAIMASDELRVGPRVGRYRVNLRSLTEIGASSLAYAAASCDLIVCDEVGPMELFSPEIRREVTSILDADKLCLLTLHSKSRDPLCEYIRNHSRARIYEVTVETRDSLAKELQHSILRYLEEKRPS